MAPAPDVSSLEPVDDMRIEKMHALVYPQLLLEDMPLSSRAKITVTNGRKEITNVLSGCSNSDRVIAIVGPCSIHDPASALDYAQKLKVLKDRFNEDLVIVMRVYFEKPRTITGWKGLINDPFLDMSFEINKGLRIARRLLTDINNQGLPVGCEFLDTMVPQYVSDLTAWAAVGARTTECQLHRELASGLSMPVGFKNGTSGDTQIAIDACRSAHKKHCFLGITKHGLPAACHSKGNKDAHIVLRGGTAGQNFESHHTKAAYKALSAAAGGSTKLIVDCSHGNSLKDPKKQCIALRSICEQIKSGEECIGGIMLESHLKHGAQALPKDDELDELRMDRTSREDEGEFLFNVNGSAIQFHSPVLDKLEYGVSVTDGCIGWEETEQLLTELAEAVRHRRSTKVTQA